ncbi:MAG: thioredoxin [Holosporales bacterium]|nr:thioredoxin [Holosporales bacterium]
MANTHITIITWQSHHITIITWQAHHNRASSHGKHLQSHQHHANFHPPEKSATMTTVEGYPITKRVSSRSFGPRGGKKMLPATTQDAFQVDVLESSQPVIVDFYATWCGPCRMLTPILEELIQENPGVRIYTVNVDDFPQLASNYDVRNLPTLLVFKHGEVVARNAGAATKFEIEDLLQV